MSHGQHINYGYPAPSNYYVDEQEGFGADFSDSDAFSENQHYTQHLNSSSPANMYPRNAAQRSSPQTMHNKSFYERNPPPFRQQQYYEQPPPPIIRTHTAVPLPNYPQQYERVTVHQCCPISSSSQPETNCHSNYTHYANSMVTGHHMDFNRNIPETGMACGQESKQPNVKRYPITVGTPKYYKKPSVSNMVYKRPSALCLPVASQPDPAVYRKPKKANFNDFPYPNQQNVTYSEEFPKMEVLKKQSIPEIMPHKVDSAGDVNTTNLEDMLEKIEKDQAPEKVKSKTEISKLSKYLKPRAGLKDDRHESTLTESSSVKRDIKHSTKAVVVEPDVQRTSVKAKQDKMRLKSMKLQDIVSHNITSTMDGDDKKMAGLEIREVSAHSLEKLLNQLKKCEFADNASDNLGKNKTERCEEGRKGCKPGNPDANPNEIKRPPTQKSAVKSFNYRDIADSMLRTSSDLKAHSDSAHASTTSIQELTRRLKESTSNSGDGSCGMPRATSAPRPAHLDDACALELHRSKSYIVNLIDRALSKELGTVPGDRTRREFENMSPKRAIDLMNRHAAGKSQKDISLEIASALTDSIISNATAPDTPHSQPSISSNNNNKVCCCSVEEPTYIKQLKQLRWGHLKHIQREVRRLEDLERFLDSCSITTIPEI